MAYYRHHGVNTAIARIFNTYGPRMRPFDGRVVPTFLRQALRDEPLTIQGDGTQTRSFCYITDLIEGLVRLVRSDIHDPTNLGNPEEMRVADLARLVIDLTGSTSSLTWTPLPQDDPKSRCPDITRAKTLLAWKPTVPLQRGLALTVDWLRTQC
jgi:dTDP-glucose 4,6-dehydratase